MGQEDTRTDPPVGGAGRGAQPIELQTLLGALGIGMPAPAAAEEAPADAQADGEPPAQLQTPFGAFAFTFTDDDGTVHEGAAAFQKSMQALSSFSCGDAGCGCGGGASESPPDAG